MLIMSGIAQPFMKTPIIETDATLNKDVGRNTKKLYMKAKNSNVSAECVNVL